MTKFDLVEDGSRLAKIRKVKKDPMNAHTVDVAIKAVVLIESFVGVPFFCLILLENVLEVGDVLLGGKDLGAGERGLTDVGPLVVGE
jgi:hypothetical protein